MRLRHLGFLCLSLSTFSAAFCATEWPATATRYIEQADKPHRWDSRPKTKPAALKLVDVLKALPAPDQWSAVSATYAEKLEDTKSVSSEEILMQLLLNYLNGHSEATHQSLAQLEATLAAKEETSDHLSSVSELRNELYQTSIEIPTEDIIERFEQELKAHAPLDEGSISESLGNQAALAELELYMKAQQQLLREYMKAFQAETPEDPQAIFSEYETKATALLEKYPLASELMESEAENPMLEKYIMTLYGASESNYIPSIQVPDLVTLAGEEEATRLLTLALKTPVRLQINNADATKRLAQRLALENIKELAAAQWYLVHQIDQVPLYEGMDTKFPLEGDLDDNYERKNALGYYFWGLVAATRVQDAMQLINDHPTLAENLPYGAVRAMIKAGYTKEVWAFLDHLLRKSPQVDLWDDYMALSAELGKTEPMLENVRHAIENSDDKLDQKSVIEKHRLLASAHLSAGEIELGIASLKLALAETASDREAAGAQFEAASTLVDIGVLLERAELVESGLSAAVAALEASKLESEYGGINTHSHQNLIGLYLKAGKVEAAEATARQLLDRLDKVGTAQVAKNKKAQASDHYYGGNDATTLAAFRSENDDSYQALLTMLVGIQIQKEDYPAALKILNEESRWSTTDIASILKETDRSPNNYKLGWMVAKALHETGDSETAAGVLEAVLREASGYDPAYALYLEIKGPDAIKYFDKLYQLDQFEERPLIWKAQHLVNQGKIDEAEAITQKAIATDPSDGEQPRGDRMRVYDVMRQIKLARGQTEESQFFADVLKAIRLSENADLFYRAGLYKTAIEGYRNSLEFFQDAYCIQSRIAVRLYDEGDTEEAMIHYKKAYELMPSSFGRVESHCFGCESVFKGDKPQSIAEEVFQNLLLTQPEVPQVHYLMGYLRDYQDRETEALKHLQDAVKLDPDYLNAWKKIESLSERMQMDAATKDQLILKIYALDPLGKHSSPSLQEVRDIKKMWQAVLDNRELVQILPKHKTVYPLKASAEAGNEQSASIQDFFMSYDDEVEHPAEALIRNAVIEKIEDLFIQLSQTGDTMMY